MFASAYGSASSGKPASNGVAEGLRECARSISVGVAAEREREGRGALERCGDGWLEVEVGALYEEGGVKDVGAGT